MCEDRGGTGREGEGTEQVPGDSYRHDRPASAFLTESRPNDSGGQYTLAPPAAIAIPENLQKLARRYIPARGDEPASPKALVHASAPTSAVPIAGRHRRQWAAARRFTVVLMRLGGRLLPALRHQHDWNRGRSRFSCRQIRSSQEGVGSSPTLCTDDPRSCGLATSRRIHTSRATADGTTVSPICADDCRSC
jgi:hypothetical protein